MNARTVAAERGHRGRRVAQHPRRATTRSLISVKLHTSAGERWVEGAVVRADVAAAGAARRHRRRGAARRHDDRHLQQRPARRHRRRSARSSASTASTSRTSRSAATATAPSASSSSTRPAPIPDGECWTRFGSVDGDSRSADRQGLEARARRGRAPSAVVDVELDGVVADRSIDAVSGDPTTASPLATSTTSVRPSLRMAVRCRCAVDRVRGNAVSETQRRNGAGSGDDRRRRRDRQRAPARAAPRGRGAEAGTDCATARRSRGRGALRLQTRGCPAMSSSRDGRDVARGAGALARAGDRLARRRAEPARPAMPRPTRPASTSSPVTTTRAILAFPVILSSRSASLSSRVLQLTTESTRCAPARRTRRPLCYDSSCTLSRSVNPFDRTLTATARRRRHPRPLRLDPTSRQSRSPTSPAGR